MPAVVQIGEACQDNHASLLNDEMKIRCMVCRFVNMMSGYDGKIASFINLSNQNWFRMQSSGNAKSGRTTFIGTCVGVVVAGFLYIFYNKTPDKSPDMMIPRGEMSGIPVSIPVDIPDIPIQFVQEIPLEIFTNQSEAMMESVTSSEPKHHLLVRASIGVVVAGIFYILHRKYTSTLNELKKEIIEEIRSPHPSMTEKNQLLLVEKIRPLISTSTTLNSVDDRQITEIQSQTSNLGKSIEKSVSNMTISLTDHISKENLELKTILTILQELLKNQKSYSSRRSESKQVTVVDPEISKSLDEIKNIIHLMSPPGTVISPNNVEKIPEVVKDIDEEVGYDWEQEYYALLKEYDIYKVHVAKIQDNANSHYDLKRQELIVSENEIIRLNNSLKETQLYRDNFKASVESLQEQIKAIQSWGSELEVKNTMLHDMKDEISKVAREMQSRNGALQLERDLLKKRVIEMDNEIQTLRSHLGVSDHPKNTEVRTVESEIHEITQELDYIESQKEEWDKTFDGLKTELEVKNARISELEAMIQNQNK
jgi:hypothetical protein